MVLRVCVCVHVTWLGTGPPCTIGARPPVVVMVTGLRGWRHQEEGGVAGLAAARLTRNQVRLTASIV